MDGAPNAAGVRPRYAHRRTGIALTQGRDFWTHSFATDANGRYTSFFAASDETPVPRRETGSTQERSRA